MAKLTAIIHSKIDNTLMILHHRLQLHQECTKIQIIKESGPLPLVHCYPG